MNTITIHGQKLRIGQYILAKHLFDFPCSSSTSSVCSTVFTDINARPAKIEYFIIHSIQISDTKFIKNAFAAVNWPISHPLRTCLGKPYEVWCYSVFETCNENIFLPLDNFVTCLLTAELDIEEEKVLVTIPVI